MRAMILAAGLGTRLRPFSELRAKPALPVRGIPVIGYLLELLASHGIQEVIVNLHHLPDTIRRAVAEFTPRGMQIEFSEEEAPLGTGGGIRRAAGFLRESEPSLVLAGDMLLDLDLGALVARHRDRQDLTTLVLRRDSRAGRFGTIGIDEEQRVRRIAESFDLGGESDSGVFVGVRVLASRIFDSLPERDSFEDLRDWLAPALAAGEDRIRGDVFASQTCVWEPVGTPAEYLDANLTPEPLSFMDPEALAISRGTRFADSVVIGSGAQVDTGAQLTRTVVWENERVPAGIEASDGVFARGKFRSCVEE
jgi:mannose-1-phosphate guanylyltransferase